MILAVVATAGHVIVARGWSGVHEWSEGDAPHVEIANVGGSNEVIAGRALKVAVTETQDYALVRPDSAMCWNSYQDDLQLGEAYQPDDTDLGRDLLVMTSRGKQRTELVGYEAQVPITAHPTVRHAILTKVCTEGGDSGSCLIDLNGRLWGMLVGFSDSHSVFMSIYFLLGSESATLL